MTQPTTTEHPDAMWWSNICLTKHWLSLEKEIHSFYSLTFNMFIHLPIHLQYESSQQKLLEDASARQEGYIKKLVV